MSQKKNNNGAGKGDRYRPTSLVKSHDGHERIFGKTVWHVKDLPTEELQNLLKEGDSGTRKRAFNELEKRGR